MTFSMDSLNPFEVLCIPKDPTRLDEIRKAFRLNICSASRSKRAQVALAYDMLTTPDNDKYSKYGNTYTINHKNIFYYVNTGNYETFIELIEKHKHLLDQRDEHGRTLLYIAARNGFHNICSFLLKSGCNINEIQNDGSTALHAAAYYSHQPVVELLLEYGANADKRNKFNATPEEEAATVQIRNCIQSKTQDMINILLNQLKSDETAKNMVVIKHNDKIIAKKILRNPEYFSNHSLSYLTNNWTLAWHGTKYAYLKSIMTYGLHTPGTLLSAGHRISTQAGHIGLNQQVGWIADWARAIFISPSIFYAADQVYSERIFSDNQRWCVVVEVRVKPGSYSSHKQTLLQQRDLLPGEPENIEYRVAVKSNDDFILRVESNRNVIVTALIFVNLTFLENIDEYYQGADLFASSEAERALFQ